MLSKAFLLYLMMWVSAQTGLPMPDQWPTVAFVSQETLCDDAYPFGETEQEEASRGKKRLLCRENQSVRGLYFEDRLLIEMLPTDFTTPYGLSVLVHELAHHLQFQAGREYECRGALEKVAYDAQIEFLEQLGLDFYEVAGSNKLFYLLITACNNRQP